MKPISFLLACLLAVVSFPLSTPVTQAQADAPAGVTLDYFIATAHYPTYILLEWESVSELNTQAFRIKRGVTPNLADAAVIIPYVVAHPGSPLGYYYSQQDSNSLVDGTTYYYWIEDEQLGQPNVWIAHPEYNPNVTWGFVCSVYDFNCDQAVDTLDITAVAQHWNCAQGNACYDATYDLNSDNQINVIDIELDAAHWGCEFGEQCYG